MWQELDRLHREVELVKSGAPTDRRLTARWMDERQPAGTRTYIHATQLLHVGYDNLRALQALFTQGAGVWAPWNLVRAILESAAWAAWLLEPHQGRERRVRGLRIAVQDHRDWQAFFKEFDGASTEQQRQRRAQQVATTEATYRAEADALAERWSKLRERLNLTDMLPSLAAVLDLDGVSPAVVVGMWRGLSGMAHGRSYAVMAYSDSTTLVPVPGGQTVHLTINDNRFEAHALLACWFLWSASNLYLRRSSQP